MSFTSSIKKIIPKKVLNLRHFFIAWYAARKYKHPSDEMLVIGVTGTSGKSTTIFLLRQLLESAGYKVGSLSTIDFYIAGQNKLNDQKMTMLGKMQTQKYLRDMANAGCQVAIVETTSEGALQYRNYFINYDLMLLTNLYPEHIESHGSFENYKKAKLDIFYRASTYGYARKTTEKIGFNILEKECCSEVKKVSIVNGDSDYAAEFLKTGIFDKRYTFGLRKKQYENTASFIAESVASDEDGLHFVVEGHRMSPAMFGEHNVMNILAAISVGRALGIEWTLMQKAVNEFKNAPGRCEFIKEAEINGFKVIVDYAFEPKAIAALYEVAKLLKPNRIIHVFGSTGGGRDVARRFTVGEFVGQHADICIITDEDPYDDDPMSIINDVASAVEKAGKKEGKDLLRILDRREAIQKALTMAGAGDLVLITGKGSEQAMCIAGGKKIPWDDREEVRKALSVR